MIYFITNQTELFDRYDTSILRADIRDCLEYFKEKKEIALDTETMGFDPYTKEVLSLQLGDEERQYVIDTQSVDIKLFKELLEDKNKVILMQNAKFDLRFLYHNGIICSNIYDTMLAEAVLYMGIKFSRKSLDYLTYKYCKIELDKTVRGNIHREGLSTAVIKYAAYDVKFLHQIKRKQMVEIDKKGLSNALALDNKFVRVLAYVEYSGFGFDLAKWNKKCDNDIIVLSQKEKELDNFLFTTPGFERYVDNQLDLFSTEKKSTINWSSAKQVVPIMKSLGVDTLIQDKKTGKFKDSIDQKVLSKQIDIHPLVGLYVEYSKAHKLVTSFGYGFKSFINPVTNRIHTTYRQLLDTGRMSCGESGNKGMPSYPNLQQIPADLSHRGCFVSEKNNKLIVCDYSGQESVIFANFSEEPEILNFYRQGLGDMHGFIASKIYPELEGLTLEEIKENHKQLRQNAKSAGFAIQYGGVGMTIANNLGLTLEEGEAVYNGYMNAFPKVSEYFNKCKKDALNKGYVLINTVSNRKSFIDSYEQYQNLNKEINREFWTLYRAEKEKNSDRFIKELKPKVREYFKLKGMIERKSLNYPIQGSGAECTKLAGIYIFEWILNNNLFNIVKICNIIHDEIVVEGPEDKSSEIADIVQTSMEKAGALFCKIIPLKAKPVITAMWEH